MKKIHLLYFFIAFFWLMGCEEDENEITYDITKPTVVVDESVFETVRTRGESFQLTATIADEDQLQSVRVFNTAWGIDETIEVSGQSYSLDFTVEIPEDADVSVRNVIGIEVLDGRRNKTLSEVLVNFGTDETAPVISVNSPTAAYELYSGLPVEFDVEVTDNFAIAEIVVSAEDINFTRTINGSGSTSYHFVAAGDQGGQISPLLAPGDYEITITARDMAGNEVTTTTSYKVIETPITYATIGIVGNATGSWDNSTPMNVDPDNEHAWSLTAKLTVGELKFRADNAWTVNWGSDAFPTGNGTQDGPNIPITEEGYYHITFNDRTGAYTFEKLTPTEYTTVGLIGNATAGGWDTSTPLEQDENDPHVWTGTVTLTAGEAKFRADNAWTVNWGSASFPSGIGVQDGPNFAPSPGVYFVTFNDVSGAYSFEIQSVDAVYLVGDATPAGWDNNSNVPMFRDPDNGLRFSYTGHFNAGAFKFLRTRGAWQPQWGKGASDGVLGYNGGDGSDPDVIQISTEGYYTVTIDLGALTYSVESFDASSATEYATIGIVGSAAGSWDNDVDLTKSAADPHLWILDGIDLIQGEAKFRADNDWAVNWGSSAFPYGVGDNGGANIPVTDGGNYLVVFSDLTGQYAIIKK